jgi:epoxyqueuosine reductase
MSALGANILDQARELGFDDAALVRADLGTPGSAALDRALDAGHLDALDWMARTADHRRDLRARWPWARALVVVVQNYYAGAHPEGDAPRVSRYAWGKDYHRGMRRRLRKLRSRALRAAVDAGHEDPTVAIFNDVDPILERAWAEAAGLGFIGKSSMFIHRKLGTWTFLGGLGLSVDLDAPAPLDAPLRHCGTCTRCVDACPPKAIVAPGVVDAGRCVTTWNVERPLEAPDDALAGHGWAVGCDVCQEVCPWNRFQTLTELAEFQPRHPRLDEESVETVELPGTPLARPGREGLRAAIARAKPKP